MKHRIICLLFTMLFCVCNQAAEKIPAIAEMFTLGNRIMVNEQHIQFNVLNSFRLSDGRTLTHYQQQYKNIPIWGRGVTVSTLPGQLAPVVAGEVISDIATDLNHIFPKISRKQAIVIATKEVFGNRYSGSMFSSHSSTADEIQNLPHNQQLRLWVYIDEAQDAHLAYLISWAVVETTPSRPHVFVDAVTGAVLKRWNDLAEGDCLDAAKSSHCSEISSAL